MAINTTTQELEHLPTEPHDLARHGISLTINNRAAEAQELFKSNLQSIQMSAGYSFAIFMDAVMSFEEDKIQLALSVLRETEKKCAGDIGWLKNVRTKMFGQAPASLAERLETQIILADTQVCVAIITFLQQEFSGFLKGGWVLRKAWKVYQHTYTEIIELYKKKFGNFNLPEPTDFEWDDMKENLTRNNSVSTDGPSNSPQDWSVPDSDNHLSSTRNSNGYVPISSPKLPQSQSTYIFPKSSSSYFPFSIKRSGSAHSSLNQPNMSESRSNFSLWSPISTHLSFLSSTFNLLTSSDKEEDEISAETVSRLMGAVCFGYGVLQLGISLLPPSLLKVTNIFGFNGNRMTGISNLMYSRKGTDMRAPLATLALLWFHTIVRPFYALDGTNVKAGIEAANLLIQESMLEYKESALFLFFRGRVHRLDSNISMALESFQAAANNTTSREIKLLALHDVGWCHLIQLDFEEAQKVFLKLKQGSRWSKVFYSFLAIICSGTCNNKDYTDIHELKEVYQTQYANRNTQIDIFLKRRLNILPQNEEGVKATTDFYWKLLIYETLHLWNALPSCSRSSLQLIINQCNDVSSEPMPGLAMLIQAECCCLLGYYDNAVTSYRNCIETRSKIISPKDDIHISAIAEYSLGVLLSKNAETKEEGKMLLEHASLYRDFDFDNKLHVRISQALKHVS